VTAGRIRADAPGAIEEAARRLRRGELLAIPTETVYGLAVLPAEACLRRLVEAKRRSSDKGIQLLIDSVDQVRDLVELTPAAERLAARFWPGPLTLVLNKRADVALPELLTGGRSTVGVRLPDHDVPRRLARLLGPLAASSANLAGEPAATSAEQVLAMLGEEVTLVLDDGPVRGGVASTVVACTSETPAPRILREGALSAEEIHAVLASNVADGDTATVGEADVVADVPPAELLRRDRRSD
jgi:L-threonylcarbamoyladenylate synthase